MEIRWAARKHGVADADMLHAVDKAVRIIALGDEDKTLVIGPDTTGRVLEVVVVNYLTATARIIHAMPLRASFYRYLAGR